MPDTYDSRKTPDILFINTPFDWVTSPYISIPVLAAYLQSRNISVAAYDIKREFYVQLLRPQNILQGLRHAKKRFLELNNAPKLNFSQCFEYKMLLTLLSNEQKYKKEITTLLSPFPDFSDIQNSPAIDFFIRAAILPYFPEIILPDFTDLTFSTTGCSAYNPYSSADILAACQQQNYYTHVFEKIIDDKILANYHPRIIGFSVGSPSQIIPAFQCARIMKARLPEVYITMGGAGISVYCRQVREKGLFDIIDSLVLDEGEIPLETLVSELSTPHPDLSKVPGLIYLADDQIHANPPPPPLDLEESLPPDYTVFQLDRYLNSRDNLMIPFRFSKGCLWQKCTFCRTTLPICRNYQPMSMERAYHQLVHVVKTAGLPYFIFSDDTTAPRVMEYISKKVLKDQLNIRWVTQTRISKQLTKERCKLYAKAGCVSLGLGIESLSNRILTLMNKGITAEYVEEVLHAIDGNLPLLAYMIIGFPTETEEEALQGYEKIKTFMSEGLIIGYVYSVFVIHCGSDIWNHPENYGLSEMSVPKGSDLSPDIVRFKGPGMPRKKAYQLAKQFNQGMYPPPKEWFAHELRIDDTVVPVRYDFQKLDDLIGSKSLTDLPFVKWLQAHNRFCCYPDTWERGGTKP